jgi:SNF2 family DNA or RNA helicase
VREQQVDSPSTVSLPGGFTFYRQVGKLNLYPYQEEAVQWMWGLCSHELARDLPPPVIPIDVDADDGIGASCAPVEEPRDETNDRAPGGCLAYDMGTGKTVMVSVFIKALLGVPRRGGEPRAVLVVVPKSLLATWIMELRVWAPGVEVSLFTKRSEEHRIAYVARRGGVLLTTYAMASLNAIALGAQQEPLLQPFAARGDAMNVAAAPAARKKKKKQQQGPLPGSEEDDEEEEDEEEEGGIVLRRALRPSRELLRRGGTVWDAVICDEGHKLKNPRTKTHRSLQAIPSRVRLLLTGTPLQNSED